MNFYTTTLIATLLFSLQAITTSGQNTSTDHKVFLLGNTADIDENSSFYSDFTNILPTSEKFTVLINGDLITGKNSIEPDQQDSIRIDRLLRPLSKMNNGKIIVIPGDRDWNDSGKKGIEMVKRLEKMVKRMDFDNVEWAIKKGCPGPDMIEINDHLVIVTLSTQWYNHPYDKPYAATGECKFGTQRDFLIELENLVEDAEDKNIIVAGHYPLESLGEYGGHFPASKFLSPPLIGSFKVGYRQNVGTSKDISNERFQLIKTSIKNIIGRKGSVIYAAGHEHNLQILKMTDDTYNINSGSPTKAKYASKNKNTSIYSEATAGLIELIYKPTGEINYQVHGYDSDDGFSEDAEGTLFYSSCDNIAGSPQNGIYVPCNEEQAQEENHVVWSNDTIVAAGDYRSNAFTRFMSGKHYRKTWNQPIKVEYLDLKNTKGGLTVYEKGGGHQTTSLKMKGGDGREYTFRSVDKDPTQLLPFDLQNTIISRTLQDITSIQQPYGAMVVGSMLDATDILHASPTLYMMPPSNELGSFKNKYSNLLGMLEEKPKNVEEVKVAFADADEIHQSRKMFKNLNDDHEHRVDAKEYARARVFDILVGDWGKHEDNWKWAGYEEDNGLLYRPIPRDRDYVFTKWNGFLTYLADRKWASPTGENFGYKINDMRSLTFSSQSADRRLLNELTREDWQEAAEYIMAKITPEVIERGVRTMPEEIYDLSGKEIEDKLKRRVKDLKKYADQYYEILMYHGVEVVGSNEEEFFEVIRNQDGTVQVSMYDYNNKNKTKGNNLFYQRTFIPDETDEIRLYGLSGADHFSISGDANKSIKIRVIGGPDPDDVIDKSSVKKGGKKTLIYEKSNSSKIELGDEAKMIDTWNNSLYAYDRSRHGFNRYFPIGAIVFNANQGLGLIAGVTFTTHSPVKEDYAAKHTISGYSTTRSINVFNYTGRFHHVLGKWDIQIGGIYANNNGFNNFFGIGNGTPFDSELNANRFYDSQYNSAGVNAGLIREFWKKSSFTFNLNYENNRTERNEGTILAESNSQALAGVFGVDDANLAEARMALDIDFRDRISLPEKGIRLFVRFDNGFVTNNDNSNYGITSGFLEQYFSTRGKKPLTLGLRVGGSTTYNSETIPFYKLQYLGQNSNLRGFDNNRFTGSSTAFANTELRLQLTEWHTSFLPMKFGVKGFYDIGRAFSDFDNNTDWHEGYGFGFYLVPLTESFAFNVSLGFSEENTALVLFSIGSTFN